MRLLQFLVLGGAIFFVSSRLRGGDDTIRLVHPEAGVERAVEDEILYREGLRLGFDRNDGIVRQRIIQKTLFLAEELAGASEPPNEADLRAFFARTRERWRRPERWHLVQVFSRDAGALGKGMDAPGESAPIPRDATLSRAELVATLGPAFVAALPTAPSGVVGPIASAIGFHLVRVVAYEPEAPASFAEARPSVLGAFVVERRQAAVAAFLDKALRGYDVSVDGAPVTELHPRRVAVRKSASAED